MPNLPPVAMSVLHALSDGEWHPVLYRYRPAVDVLVARGLAYSGTIDGSLAAVATDAGLALVVDGARGAGKEGARHG